MLRMGTPFGDARQAAIGSAARPQRSRRVSGLRPLLASHARQLRRYHLDGEDPALHLSTRCHRPRSPCQSLSGTVLEWFVVERLLQAVSPASLELSLAAAEDIDRGREQLDAHWRQRLTRSRYEVEQSRRQHAAVDREHRLAARRLDPISQSGSGGRLLDGPRRFR
jgi:hypothetical protein